MKSRDRFPGSNCPWRVPRAFVAQSIRTVRYLPYKAAETSRSKLAETKEAQLFCKGTHRFKSHVAGAFCRAERRATQFWLS